MIDLGYKDEDVISFIMALGQHMDFKKLINTFIMKDILSLLKWGEGFPLYKFMPEYFFNSIIYDSLDISLYFLEKNFYQIEKKASLIGLSFVETFRRSH